MLKFISNIKARAFKEGYEAGFADGKQRAEASLLETKVNSYNQGFHDGVNAETTKALARLKTKMKGGKYVQQGLN